MQSPEPFDTKYTPEEVEVEIETDDFPPVATPVSFAATLEKVKTWYRQPVHTGTGSRGSGGGFCGSFDFNGDFTAS